MWYIKNMRHIDRQEITEAVEEANGFTVDQWKELTQGWHIANAGLVKQAIKKPLSHRERSANKLIKEINSGSFEDDSDWAEMIAKIWLLSDDALSRLAEALAINEILNNLNNEPLRQDDED